MTSLRAIALIATSGLLVGCGSAPVEQTDAEATPTPKPTHSTPARVSTPPRVGQPEPGAVTVRGEQVKGEWEDGELQGKPLMLGRASLPYAGILYAAQPAGGAAYVATGVRAGSRVLKTIQMLSPATQDSADQIDLYGGYVLGGRGPGEQVSGGEYLLVGSVPGDVEVTVKDETGRVTPVTARSTRLLPGYTVFYVNAPWAPGWDQVQAAPLTVTTNDGRRVEVRSRTWTG